LQTYSRFLWFKYRKENLKENITMTEAYQLLAEQLDKIPNGYPKTKSGVELKLLAKLFTAEEAGLAASLSLVAESIKEIAERMQIPEKNAKILLVGMVKKGLIDLKRIEGKGLAFCLIPFVVGFYERQNGKIDKEFAELFEAYYQEAFHKIMGVNPSVHRVIPVERSIPVNIDVMPYEKASTYLDQANSWGVLDCICRVQKKLIGEGCDHPIENCLVFSAKVGAFDRSDAIKSLSKEEALQILADADKAGLVHSVNNAKGDVDYICNCCTCSCGVLRGMAKTGNKDAIAASDFLAVLDEDLCTGCEICIERCNFSALSVKDGVCEINNALCFGCGLCISSCPSEALKLVQKEAKNLYVPPANEEEWRELRAKAMGKFYKS
jgi:H+/Na+-translocating ferredoxin:NAD+ oxidoreductase subunit B